MLNAMKEFLLEGYLDIEVYILINNTTLFTYENYEKVPLLKSMPKTQGGTKFTP